MYSYMTHLNDMSANWDSFELIINVNGEEIYLDECAAEELAEYILEANREHSY